MSSIRDKSKVDAFAREIAGMIGVDVDDARAEVRRAANRPAPAHRPQRLRARTPAVRRPSRRRPRPRSDRSCPSLRDPRFSIERETLKIVIQHPGSIGTGDQRARARRLHPPRLPRLSGRRSRRPAGRRRLPATRAGAPGCGRAVADPHVSSAISELGVEPVLTPAAPEAAYVAKHVYRLQELTTMRRIADLKSRLQRTNPVEHQADYNKMFGELVALEQHRRTLRDQQVDGPVRPLRRPSAPDLVVGPGERVLAWCRTVDDGVLAGTRDALYSRRRPATPPGSPGSRSRPPTGMPTPTCCASRWSARGASSASSTTSGSPSPARLLELVRERVTASVVLQRHVPLAGRRGVRVIGRRAPRGNAPIEWFYEYDEGVDPADPAVRTAAAEALVAARGDVGLA